MNTFNQFSKTDSNSKAINRNLKTNNLSQTFMFREDKTKQETRNKSNNDFNCNLSSKNEFGYKEYYY